MLLHYSEQTWVSFTQIWEYFREKLVLALKVLDKVRTAMIFLYDAFVR